MILSNEKFQQRWKRRIKNDGRVDLTRLPRPNRGDGGILEEQVQTGTIQFGAMVFKEEDRLLYHSTDWGKDAENIAPLMYMGEEMKTRAVRLYQPTSGIIPNPIVSSTGGLQSNCKKSSSSSFFHTLLTLNLQHYSYYTETVAEFLHQPFHSSDSRDRNASFQYCYHPLLLQSCVSGTSHSDLQSQRPSASSLCYTNNSQL